MSQMDGDQYVPIATIAGFNQVRRLTRNVDLVKDILRGLLIFCCFFCISIFKYAVFNDSYLFIITNTI